jgi:hypothetical protein
MRTLSQCLGSLVLAAALLLSVMNVGCAEQHAYRVYDPYYHDYHRWDGNENARYRQWVKENRREDRDFRRLDRDQQHQYFDWRHSHGDRDHDNDRDHDGDHDRH